MTTFLISFPSSEDKIENIVTDKLSGNEFIKEILMVFDRIDCEKDVEVYIDSENKDKFIEDFKVLENLLNQRISFYSLEETLRIFISQNAIRILRNKNFTAKVQVKLTDGFKKVDNIFTEKNKHRKLNREDFIHCENHPNHLPNKSPLIGGTGGFDNAEKWLPSAVGDVKAHRGILLNIDRDNQGHIIRYEDEHFNNQYHAYHLVKKENGNYVVDTKKIQLLKDSRKNLKRPLKLILYRNTKAT